MHNRRFGAFLIGAWLIGSALMWVVSYQSSVAAEHIIAAPAPQVQRAMSDLGTATASQLLVHAAHQIHRRAAETWEVLQLGLAAALLASAILTTSRSKTLVISSVLLVLFAAVSAFHLSPTMNALGRVLDFAAPGDALQERASFRRLELWHGVLQVLGTIVALVATGRLLFDFYEFGAKLIPDMKSHQGSRRKRRRSVSQAAVGPEAGSPVQ